MQGLPNEIICDIATGVDVGDLITFAITCKAVLKTVTKIRHYMINVTKSINLDKHNVLRKIIKRADHVTLFYRVKDA